MIYISKGIVKPGSTENNIQIIHSSQAFTLTGINAQLWLDGRYNFNTVNDDITIAALKRLTRMSLVETETDDAPVSKYRILTRCVLCATKNRTSGITINGTERIIHNWIRDAGVHLTVAELIYLQENCVKPEPKYLYAENKQALIERIYTQNTIMDNILECQMEAASCRDYVVDTLIALLKKKRILIL